ncbi:MAG: hypothetical protein ABI895_10065 [Deltaproteobacteria bacterium]
MELVPGHGGKPARACGRFNNTHPLELAMTSALRDPALSVDNVRLEADVTCR